MSSPPSSPPPCTPPSSPPAGSPPSSPAPDESPAKKGRWQVFSFRHELQSQVSRSTRKRWEERGFCNSANTHEQHADEVGEEDLGEAAAQAGNEAGDEAVAEEMIIQAQENNSDVDVDALHQQDSDDDLPPFDSSESEGPSSNSSDSASDLDAAEGGGHADGWYDSDEERFNEEEEQRALHDSDDEDGLVPLYSGCQFSKEEAILDLLDNFLSNKETQKSLKDHLATFIKYLPAGNTMPKSIYLLFKYLKSLASSYVPSTFYYCSKCLMFTKQIDLPCPACDCSSFKEFYMIDLMEQIKFYFEHCDLASILDDYRAKCNERSSGGKISDICDGAEYIRVKVDEKYSITLMWNTDGVSLSNSSKSSLYPILTVICEIPPKLRSHFLIVAGVWCDSATPPMNTLLRPFCENLVKIEACGGVEWTHPQSGEKFCSFVTAPLACADAPVRAQIQNIISHRGKHSCHACEQKSEKIPLTNHELREKAAGNKKIRRKRGFFFKNPGALLRSHKRMAKQARKAVLGGKSVKGVFGFSVVQKIPRLDVSTCVMAEYMHCVCLGVVRQFLNLWVNVPGAWYIGDKIDEIDEMLLSIKPPDIINRLPRKVSEMFKWKASELRTWHLFYSLIIAGTHLPENYTQHWMCFVLAVQLLLQEQISESDLDKAQALLNIFVNNIGRLYHKKELVYNVHQLLHLPLYVKRWGPLWATSAFMFEDFNGLLADIIHGTKNRAKELINLMQVSHGVEMLRERIRLKCDLAHSQKGKGIELLNECKIDKLCDDDKEFVLSSGFTAPMKILCRISFQREIFTSLLYPREVKRNNYCVGFKEKEVTKYGEIKFFVCKDACPNDTFAVVETFRVNHIDLFLHEATRTVVNHIVPVQPSNNLALVHVKFLFKVVKVGSYLCLLPNMYERKL